MKIGVFDPVFGALELEPMLDRIREFGLEAVELGCGNYPGDPHCNTMCAPRHVSGLLSVGIHAVCETNPRECRSAESFTPRVNLYR